MKTVERLADVDESNGTTEVSPITIAMRSGVDAELLGGDLRQHGSRTLAHVRRGRQHRDAAVVVQRARSRAKPTPSTSS